MYKRQSLDNSSCNLASLNLLKFLREDDTFDAQTFQTVSYTHLDVYKRQALTRWRCDEPRVLRLRDPACRA